MKFLIYIFLLVALIVLGMLGTTAWEWYIKPDPESHNFIGMNRTEVLQWLDENARIKPESGLSRRYWNKIHIGIKSLDCFYNSIEESLKDDLIFKYNRWEIDYQQVSQGRSFETFIYFENDIVIKQSSGSRRDW